MRVSVASFVFLSATLTLACSGSDEDGVGSGSSGGSSGSAGTATSGGSGGSSGSGGSGGDAGSGGNGGSTGGSGGTGVFGPGNETFSMDMEVFDVDSGEENTQCIVKRLNNPTPILVNQMHNVISSSSHHMIVYRTNDTEERTEPFDCVPFLETLNPEAGAPLMVTQKKDDTLQLPPKVGYTLEANQMLRIELHYINTTPTPVDVKATAMFTTLAEEDYEHEADFLFIGNPDISIPAQSSWSLGPSFFKLPNDLQDVNFYAITGHTHQYGTDVYIEAAAGEDDPNATPVYDVPGWEWDEPATQTFDPPFQVPEGGGFNFTCDWNNTSNSNVGFGESANQEMCFFWAYYYPSRGARVCVRSDRYISGLNACCPGDTLCSLIDGFLN